MSEGPYGSEGACRAQKRRAGARPLQTHRGELACGEVFQGAEAGVEFSWRQAALAVERAQKIRGGMLALAEVAVHTAGNQVAVGIAFRRSPLATSKKPLPISL